MCSIWVLRCRAERAIAETCEITFIASELSDYVRCDHSGYSVTYTNLCQDRFVPRKLDHSLSDRLTINPLGTASTIPIHFYPRYLARAVGGLLQLGASVDRSAQERAPAARRIMAVSNEAVPAAGSPVIQVLQATAPAPAPG